MTLHYMSVEGKAYFRTASKVSGPQRSSAVSQDWDRDTSAFALFVDSYTGGEPVGCGAYAEATTLFIDGRCGREQTSVGCTPGSMRFNSWPTRAD